MSLRNLAKAESMNDRYAYPNTSTIDSDVHSEMFSTIAMRHGEMNAISASLTPPAKEHLRIGREE
jgi:hypothetical protein